MFCQTWHTKGTLAKNVPCKVKLLARQTALDRQNYKHTQCLDSPRDTHVVGTYCLLGSPSCSRARSKISWHRLLKMNLRAISDFNKISNWVILWSEVNMKIKTWIRFEIHLYLLSLHSDLNQTWKFYNVVYVPLKYLWPWFRFESDFNIW